MIVALTGVGLSYGDITALSGVDLTVEDGERVALVGQSGAGKSSLIDLCAGLVTPTSGRIDVLDTHLVDGITGLGRRHRRSHGRRLGIVAQSSTLAPSLGVVHNVNAGRLGSWSTWAALRSLIRPLDVDGAADALEAVRLADRIGARTGDLSGGERQRVAVARVLRQRPDLVLADEPTASVDPELADLVMSLLCTTDGGAPWTTIVSVHDPELARRHATRVVGMRAGSIRFDVHPSALTDEMLDDLYAHSTSTSISRPSEP